MNSVQGSIDITTPEFQALDTNEEESERARLDEAEAEDAAMKDDFMLLSAPPSDADVGTGWYFPFLETFGAGLLLVGHCFQCSPSGNRAITELPVDHPIRAIFSLFKYASAPILQREL